MGQYAGGATANEKTRTMNVRAQFEIRYRSKLDLLLLLNMHGVLSQTWAKLLDAKFFTTGFSLQRVVVITRFLANEMDDFLLFLTLGHGLAS